MCVDNYSISRVFVVCLSLSGKFMELMPSIHQAGIFFLLLLKSFKAIRRRWSAPRGHFELLRNPNSWRIIFYPVFLDNFGSFGKRISRHVRHLLNIWRNLHQKLVLFNLTGVETRNTGHINPIWNGSLRAEQSIEKAQKLNKA